ncbi:MAG: class I SAM-dependent methyltransferase, partial [Candidatus Krumholzibacteriota bacterium]|nr:class I SAM-dependent methyltransferase [Candidatus Krumholzibacteriota bacterium]
MSGERWYELAFGPLYPVLYDHRDAEEARRAMAGFGEELASRQPVMDLACGAGRYLDVLHDSDTEAFGLDLSPTLLAMAAHSHTGRVARADMRFRPLRAGSVGAVISMFTSYGYFETDEENFVVLTEIERVLRPGGILLLDFFNAIPILRDPSRNSKRESGGFAIEEKRKISDDGRF